MKQSYLKDVATIQLDTERCIGCGRCVEVCPHGVFEINNKKTRILSKDSCMECGACVLNCPTNALEVDAGVGCAAAIIVSWFTGKEPTCGCSGDNSKACC